MSSKEEEVTPRKKKEPVKVFKTRIRPQTALYEVYLEDGGQLPEKLKSLYTSTTEATKQIQAYEANRRKYY
jgi:hypothetical protein